MPTLALFLLLTGIIAPKRYLISYYLNDQIFVSFRLGDYVQKTEHYSIYSYPPHTHAFSAVVGIKANDDETLSGNWQIFTRSKSDKEYKTIKLSYFGWNPDLDTLQTRLAIQLSDARFQMIANQRFSTWSSVKTLVEQELIVVKHPSLSREDAKTAALNLIPTDWSLRLEVTANSEGGLFLEIRGKLFNKILVCKHISHGSKQGCIFYIIPPPPGKGVV